MLSFNGDLNPSTQKKLICGTLQSLMAFGLMMAGSMHVETASIDVCVQRSWQMLTGESPLVVKVGQPISQ